MRRQTLAVLIVVAATARVRRRESVRLSGDGRRVARIADQRAGVGVADRSQPDASPSSAAAAATPAGPGPFAGSDRHRRAEPVPRVRRRGVADDDPGCGPRRRLRQLESGRLPAAALPDRAVVRLRPRQSWPQRCRSTDADERRHRGGPARADRSRPGSSRRTSSSATRSAAITSACTPADTRRRSPASS